VTTQCQRCHRGAESCAYCENVSEQDWEAICDCGLYDFGSHLIPCEDRTAFKYVIAADHAQAAVRVEERP
jgi:hypothetical protein